MVPRRKPTGCRMNDLEMNRNGLFRYIRTAILAMIMPLRHIPGWGCQALLRCPKGFAPQSPALSVSDCRVLHANRHRGRSAALHELFWGCPRKALVRMERAFILKRKSRSSDAVAADSATASRRACT